jgi:predicted AlkP superfamily pyrophosphatase or phosphodiesterase
VTPLSQELIAGSVLPSYDGRGISSIPATILEAFGGRLDGHPPLHPDILPPSFLDGVSTIVFILVDGLGLGRWRRALAGHPHLALGRLAREGRFGELTSVLPSTTTAALATLSTGLTPQEHGLIGYKLFLREVNEIANMIRFSPVSKTIPYPRRRLNPQAFFDHTTLYERLHGVGASTRVIIKAGYVHSPLSRMFYRGAEIVGHPGTHDAFVILRRMLEQRDGAPSLIYLYWDPVDNVSHYVGPDGDEVEAEILGFDDALRRHVLERVKAPDVALLITADHGHVHTVPSRRLNFNGYPEILDRLLRPPCGDSRLPYLHVREGMVDEVRAAVLDRFGHVARFVTTEEALAAGLFGIGEVHPEVPSRLGDAIVPVAGGWKVGYRWSNEEHESIGCHGALDEEEMRVPLIAARLG